MRATHQDASTVVAAVLFVAKPCSSLHQTHSCMLSYNTIFLIACLVHANYIVASILEDHAMMRMRDFYTKILKYRRYCIFHFE